MMNVNKEVSLSSILMEEASNPLPPCLCRLCTKNSDFRFKINANCNNISEWHAIKKEVDEILQQCDCIICQSVRARENMDILSMSIDDLLVLL